MAAKRSPKSAYDKGVAAWENGRAKCPYNPKNGSNHLRKNFWDGFYDARANAVLGHIFDKYDMNHHSMHDEI